MALEPRRPGWARPAGARQASWGVLIVGMLANGLYFMVPIGWTSPWYVATGAACAALMAARLGFLGSTFRGWALLTAGQSILVISDTIFLTSTYPTAGVTNGAAYVLLLSGLLLLVTEQQPDSHVLAVVDMAIVSSIAVLLLGAGPLLGVVQPAVVELAGLLAFLVLDAVVLALAWNAMQEQPRRTTVQVLILTGLAALLLGDVAALLVDADVLVHGRSLADAGWLVSKVVLAAAILHPSARQQQSTPAGHSRSNGLVIVLAAPVLIPLVLVLEAARTGQALMWGFAALAAMLVGLVVIRLVHETRFARVHAEEAGVRAAAEERARLTRELHDILAHALSTVVLQIDAARLQRQRDPLNPVLIDQLDRASRLARNGLRSARTAISTLDGGMGTNVSETLPRLINDFAGATSIPADLRVDGTSYPLPSTVSLALYRTVQESLTNVVKHAPAAESVQVQLRFLASGCELVVEDRCAVPDGVGAAFDSAGHGLRGLRQRADMVGGNLWAEPGPHGFRVRLWIPRPAA